MKYSYYPLWIHKDPKSLYGVTVPDLPGCFSSGSTFDEAIDNAREAIELHLEGMIEDGESIPDASEIESLWRNKNFSGGTWATVAIDPAKLKQPAVRINITFPTNVLGAVDRFAEQHGETRSGLLVKAVTGYIKQADVAAKTDGQKSRRAG
jgi:predicted RNase H-like HicB family nuclease